MATTYVCDCCQKVVKGLVTLRDHLQLPHIKEICQVCLKALEKAQNPISRKHEEEITESTKNFLVDRRTEMT